MDEPTDNIRMIKGGKKDPCVYCGEDQHKVVLGCPRIEAIVISSEGCVAEIIFRDDWFPETG